LQNNVINGVYKISNMINNKVYIGESFNIKRRWKEHIQELINNSHYSLELQKDYNTYGKDNFKFEVLEEVEYKYKQVIRKCLLIILEDKYIRQYNSIKEGYNNENTLELILKGEKALFNNKSIDGREILIIKKIIKNIENNGVYIPSKNAIKKETESKIKKELKPKIKKVTVPKDGRSIITKENVEIVADNCKNYIFENNFMKLNTVLKDIGFSVSKIYQILRDINILNNENIWLIDDDSMFKMELKLHYENKYYVAYLSRKGFKFILTKVLKYILDNKIEITFKIS